LLGFFWLWGCSLRRDLPQLYPELLIVGLLVDIVNIDVADDAVFVDDKDRPL
jgi:hypothetical protein